jgi:hypothetical protein
LDDPIKHYADSLYEKALFESAAELNREITKYRNERSKTQDQIQLFSGPDYQVQVRIHVGHIERVTAARLDSYQKAFGDISAQPTEGELREILNDFKATWELQIRHTTQALSRFLATRSAPPGIDPSAELRAGSAPGHDRVLREWKIWRSRVLLQKNFPKKLASGFEASSQDTSDAPEATLGKQWDVFICHASEDKGSLVRPLATILEESGLKVWYDEFTLKIGDSLRRKIDEGLANSRYGIVVLSKYFFEKNWPQQELDGLLSKENVGIGTKVILPVWHNISLEEIRQNSPILSGRVAAKSSDGLPTVARQLREAMGLAVERNVTAGRATRYQTERLQLVRQDLGKVPQEWQRALLRELLIRGQMDEAHASGFLVEKGFGQISGALNSLQFHTSFVVRDFVGQYSVNSDLRDAISEVLGE